MEERTIVGGSFVEKNVKDMPVKDVVWHGAQVETEGTRIEDPGTGKPILLRQFEFRYPPNQKGKPTVGQILTPGYKKYLNNLLWVDELEMILEPKVVFYKKGFRVFCTCQPKKGSLLPSHAPKVLPIQDIIQDIHGKDK